MQLYEICRSVAKRRAELDLTQAQLAKLSGLSRFTVNQLETGKVKDLAINKLIPRLSVLGIELTAKPRPNQKGLFKASVSANVSYMGKLTETQLARALTTGKIPPGCESQVSVILDEVPVPVVVKAVKEAARSSGIAPKKIWKNLATWSKDLHLYRRVWE
ncbi:helix-turn-helix domain-containing protein [Caballeronia sp. SEWSISQ10-4 2]|uniref:helix-turn-helix transcriptional regulator n=1 Tax=Caballeronia sp. SEWSISQ10-4 2 TaxID=2937438 RepID=UPI002650E23C|nr:helix-turn-helix domain-containing protein [Caballeronia sp. SEWSISQ10-4 2]MDN7179921.1 helix-turn-helix domain-containing protein [Caballeronia sp. SEWSISQ10-4 2]